VGRGSVRFVQEGRGYARSPALLAKILRARNDFSGGGAVRVPDPALGGVGGVRWAWYTRGVTEHRVHLLWLTGRGLHLWAEKVDGHAVVVDAASVDSGDLPEPLQELLLSRPLRARETIRVATPKGKLRELRVPSQGYTPEQALGVLAELSGQLASAGDGGLGADAVWFIRFHDFLRDAVRAGRVMVRMHFEDGQWFPVWCLSSAGDHNRVLHEFENSAPVVLTVNGGPGTVRRAADELVHWMCVRMLGESGYHPDNHMVRALVEGNADRRLNPTVAEKLSEWRSSAQEAVTRLVFVLDDPGDRQRDGTSGSGDVTDVPRWRLGVRLSVDGNPAEDIPAAESTDRQKRSLRRGLDLAYRTWPPLERMGTAVESWLTSGVWFPPAEMLTGDQTTDRSVALALTTDDVEALLDRGARELAGAGIEVLVPRGWSRVRPTVRAKASPVGTGPGEGRMGTEQVLSFDWSISVDGEELTESEKYELLTTARTVVEVRGRFIRLDGDALQRARSYFRTISETERRSARAAEKDRLLREQITAELADKKARRGENVVDLHPDLHPLVTVADLLSAELASAEAVRESDDDLHVDLDGWVGTMLSAVNNRLEGVGGPRYGLPAFEPPEQVPVPAAVTVPLRDHQRRGLNWLAWMYRHRLGAILADDMGLGKTLQVLALLAWEREADEVTGPTLVVAPTTVLEAWRREVAEHVPSLTVLLDHGSRKVPAEEFAGRAAAADLVVTSYGTLARNPDRYRDVTWGRVVADEAQNIKNPGTAQSEAIRGLTATQRLALTGTPVENRLGELHSLMDFCNPGVLGSAKAFHSRMGAHIERDHDVEATSRLRAVVSPFILRREKTDESLGLGLPSKTEYVDLVPLTGEQAALYQAYTENIEFQLENSASARRSGLILAALSHVKQICNHPAHFTGDGSGLLTPDGGHRSGKVRRLFEIIGEAQTDGRRVLVFTQFATFAKMLAPEIAREFGGPVPVLDGSLSRTRRNALVEDFQSDEGPKVMILSTRAGGTGITLTHASVVVHVDRWWNPAVEDQATDRAYRIGQDQDVTVHKLVATGTLDERINDVLSAKRELADDIVGQGEGWLTRLDNDTLRELWALNDSSVKRSARFRERNPGLTDRLTDGLAKFEQQFEEQFARGPRWGDGKKGDDDD
jgi:superfamily II DNA or RNA helicase